MKKIRRWDPAKRRYEPHLVMDKWNLKVYSNDMEEVINCARCGKKLLFGDGYTSRQIHTGLGFGYTVCKKCYEQEMEEENEARKIN